MVCILTDILVSKTHTCVFLALPAVTQAEKEKAVQDKAYTEAVQSHQSQEEILGFWKIPVQSQFWLYQIQVCCCSANFSKSWLRRWCHPLARIWGWRWGITHNILQGIFFPSSRIWQYPQTLQFSAISLPPVIKTIMPNGHTLVHRVENENAAVHHFSLCLTVLGRVTHIHQIYASYITSTCSALLIDMFLMSVHPQ